MSTRLGADGADRAALSIKVPAFVPMEEPYGATEDPTSMATTGEADRLEQLWSGEFGDQYVARNAHAGGARGPFWAWHFEHFHARSVLEIGCNVGANLRCFAELAEPKDVWGVDVNEASLRHARASLPLVNTGWAVARHLPFGDRVFDLTVSVAVLIHQPDDCIGEAIDELVRCSNRYVSIIEYTAPSRTEVVYRGQQGAFIKRPFGDLVRERHPGLRLAHRQAVTKSDGFDDGMELFVFERL